MDTNKLDKDNVMLVEFEEGYSNSSMVALYNSRRATEEQAMKAICMNGMGVDTHVVIMTKEQFCNVFLTDEAANMSRKGNAE